MNPEYKELIDSLAEDFIHVAPLPDNTPLQKTWNHKISTF